MSAPHHSVFRGWMPFLPRGQPTPKPETTVPQGPHNLLKQYFGNCANIKYGVTTRSSTQEDLSYAVFGKEANKNFCLLQKKQTVFAVFKHI